MIWKKWLNTQELKSRVERFIEEKDSVIDVVLYGSVVRGEEPRDIDFTVLVERRVGAGEKLTIAQELKEEVKDLTEKKVDVKGASFENLMDPSFTARSGILSEGYSLKNDKFLAETMGLNPYLNFTYSLEGLSQSEKTMFYYALRGRRGEKGILDKLDGKKMGRGSVLIPVQNSEEFKETLKKHGVNFDSRTCLLD